MVAGRRALPDEKKKFQGTLNTTRAKKPKPKFRKIFILPPTPEWMSPMMAQIYENDGRKLLILGILKEVNLGLFCLYCHWQGLALELAMLLSTIQKRFEKHTDSLGNVSIKMNGMQRLQLEASQQARLYAAEFGLTPGSEGRVSIPGAGPGDTNSDTEEFLKYLRS